MPHVKHPKNQNALLLTEILPLSENFGLVPTTIFSKEGRWHCCRFFPCCEKLARWICNEEEIAEVSVLEWQSLLKKRRGDTWAISSLSCVLFKLKLQHSGSQEKWTLLCLMPTQTLFSSLGFVSLRAGFGLVGGSILRCSWWYTLRGKGECTFPAGRQQSTFWVCSSQPTWAAVSIVIQMM